MNQIYLKIIEKSMDLQELVRKGTLIRYLYIHDMNEISDIEQKFTETSCRDFAYQNLLDHKRQDY